MLRRWMLALAIVAAALWAAPAALANDPTLRIAVDADYDSSTGCAVEFKDASSATGYTVFQGAEYTVVLTVDAFPDPPQVSGSSLVSCPPAGGSAQTTALPNALEVAANEGIAGSDAVPVQIPLKLLGDPETVRIGIEATNTADSNDVLLDSNSAPIVINVEELGIEVPSLASYGLLVLGVFLVLAGIFSASRKSRTLVGLGVLVLLVTAGLRVDPAYGTTGWLTFFQGLDPVATDFQGDSANGEANTDIWAVVATRYNGNLFLQVAMADVELSRCRTGDSMTDPDCDGVCDWIDDSSSIDCDGVCGAGDTSAGHDCDSVCGVGDDVGSEDCDTVCDAGEPDGGVDCDGACTGADAAASPDCNGICELSDNLVGPDCDDSCDSNDLEGSPDCPAVSECPDQCGCYALEDGSCECIRVRKEVRSMTVEERTRYIDTFKAAYADPNGPLRTHIDNHVRFFSRGLHNNGAFLPWHRGCMLGVENILQAIDCRVTIPYWDWTLNPRIMNDVMWDVGADDFSPTGVGPGRCVEDGPFGFHNGFALTNGRCLQRRITGGTTANPHMLQTQLFNRYPNPAQYDQFRNRLEHGPGLHDSVHCMVGGTMCSARSSNDPVFFMHHANIDKIWVDWQDQSPAHLDYYEGNTALNNLMPTSPWTPAQMLDNEDLPDFNGCSVKVVYEVDRCDAGHPCGAGLVCIENFEKSDPDTCGETCPECTGICVTEESQVQAPSCSYDWQCGVGEWCRAGFDGQSLCVLAQDEGEACSCDVDNVCTATESAALRCGDELKCQSRGTEELGMCVRPCDETCGSSSSNTYCSPIGSCREVGTCRIDVDCDVEENIFEGKLSAGEGFGFCVYNECKSECGDAKCVDLAGLDFGSCDDFLGWGRLWGVCQAIEGCNYSDAAERFNLFTTEGQCNEQCIDYQGCREACAESCTTGSCLETCFDACECKLR